MHGRILPVATSTGNQSQATQHVDPDSNPIIREPTDHCNPDSPDLGSLQYDTMSSTLYGHRTGAALRNIARCTLAHNPILLRLLSPFVEIWIV